MKVLINGPYEVEQKSHKLLKNYNENKEWFRCDVIKAVAAIREAAGNAIIHESINFTFDIVDKLDLKLTCETETIAEIIHTADIFEKNETVSFTSGKFVVQDGIAFDTETGLTWLRFAHGQQWEKNNVIGEAKQIGWQDAMAIPIKFNQKGYAGYNNWRLPNIDELKTLIDRNKGIKGNYIHADVFPKNRSSSLNDSGAWLVFFNDGSCYDFFKDWLHGGFVRLVR